MPTWISVGFLIPAQCAMMGDLLSIYDVRNFKIMWQMLREHSHVQVMVISACVVFVLFRRWKCSCRNRRRLSRTQVRFRGRWKCQLKLLCMMTMVHFGHCMDAQVVDRLSEIAQASTAAARAAVAAVERMSGGSQSSTPGVTDVFKSLETATKVLRSPPVFTGEDSVAFIGWKHQFLNWLGFADPQFIEALNHAEGMAVDPDMARESEAGQVLSKKLYTVLTSYLKGAPLQLSRANQNSQNGLALWRQLCNQYQPHTRQRAMGLMQALMNYPSFSNAKPVLDQVLRLEELAQEYRIASGNAYSDDLLISTLLRCCQPEVRRHLQLTMNGGTTYAEIRESVLLFERTCQTWDPNTILQQFGNRDRLAGGNQNANDGPTPMEVDRVGYGDGQKGKGKWNNKGGKGKGSKGGKGSPWWLSGGAGAGKGSWQPKGGKGKGKGKWSKGEKGSKGYKGGKSKSKNKSKDSCRICGQYGHWGNECPRRVQNVQEEPGYEQPQQALQAPQQLALTSGPATAYRTPPNLNAKQVVRQVRVFNIGTPPQTVEENWEPVEDEFDVFARGSCCMVMETADEIALHSDPDILVVLDSGSDVSLLPFEYSAAGQWARSRNVILEDAQGGKLETRGTRRARVTVKALDGSDVSIEDTFILANVQNVLISFGRLLRKQWRLVEQHGVESGLALEAPDGSCRTAVVFRRNSLAIRGQICRVTHATVATIVAAPQEAVSAEHGRWYTTSDGTPYCKSTGHCFVDASEHWSQYWPYRTTLVRSHATRDRRLYVDLDDKTAEIADCAGIDHDIHACGTFRCECDRTFARWW